MNVFYFTSDVFVGVAATSMVSLMENNVSVDEITFYVVDDGISEDNKAKLSAMIMAYNRSINYINALDPALLFDYPFKSRYQIGHSYPRMAVGSLLPKNLDRVLALDSDTLIDGNIYDFYNMDMKGNIIAGVADCLNLRAYKKQFGLDGEEFYCNAGVFLIDLEKWRQEHIEDEIKNIIKNKKGNVFFFEQTLMNYACRGKILKLHPTYNCYTLLFAFNYENLLIWRRPTIFYTEDEVKDAINSPTIIHFTRNFYMLSRPWIKGCDHPLTDTYLEYKMLTPWNNLENGITGKKQINRYKLLHAVPQKLIAYGVGIIYNIIRPKLWWKNE